MRPRESTRGKDEEGQSLTELAVGIPFLVLIIIAVIEMGLVFATYISLINATREGAIFASMYPQLVNPANDGQALQPGNTTIWQEYKNRVRNEVFVTPFNDLVAGQLVNAGGACTAITDCIDVQRPVISGSSEPGDPITVTVRFELHSFTSGVSLPFFGRFGLPPYYMLQYSMGMPIR